MKLTTIDKSTYYFRGNILGLVDNDKLLKQLFSIKSIFKSLVRKQGKRYAFDQVEIQVSTFEINFIKDYAASFLAQRLNKLKNYTSFSWALFGSNGEKGYFHDHSQIWGIENEWSVCYYVQIPNNIKDDEAKLLFKGYNGEITGFLPDVGDIVIFPANAVHMPVPTSKSTVQRVVFCTNLSFLDLYSIKSDKSTI